MSKYKVGDKVLIEGEVVEVDNYQRMNTRIAFKDETEEWFADEYIIPAYKTYEDGLNDAWELARKIVLKTEMGGICYDDFKKIFGVGDYVSVLRTMTPQEALAKIEAYEKSQQIEVGDVVSHQGLKGVVTRVTEDCIHVLTQYGTTPHYTASSGLKKTGRHIDIQHLLEQIRGDE